MPMWGAAKAVLVLPGFTISPCLILSGIHEMIFLCLALHYMPLMSLHGHLNKSFKLVSSTHAMPFKSTSDLPSTCLSSQS